MTNTFRKHLLTAVATVPVAVAALSIPGDALADGKQISGWECVDLWDDSDALWYSTGGGAGNLRTVAVTFGCPMVKDGTDVDDLKIYLLDRSSSDGFSCIISQRDRWGGGSWSATRSTGNSYLGQATLDFADGDIFNSDAHAINLARCVVPAADPSNGSSFIRSIHFDEN